MQTNQNNRDNINGLKALSFIWLALGILFLTSSVNHYIERMQGSVLYAINLPATFIMKQVLWSFSGVVIGLFLFINPKKIVVELYSIVIWLLFFDICDAVRILIRDDDTLFLFATNIFFNGIFSLMTLLLVLPTIWILPRTKLFDMNTSYKRIWQENRVKIIIQTILFSMIGFSLIEIFPFR